ncbi:hypothetical protein [Teredinibacter haidensis]|uniref:hypothetical protein n=1 Tax=Teredinibacter haidensis TaxID=2731755 RepID=UPI000948A17C|nr:hypothetical protein [Teredinibacter haidensis]
MLKKLFSLVAVTLSFSLSSLVVTADEAAQQMEEMTVMGAVKSQDAISFPASEDASEEALKDIPVIEE